VTADVVLALRDLRVRHAAGFTLEVDSLEARRGEVLAVIGPNGAGKSTLLRAMGLLEPPGAGAVWLHGQRVDAAHALAARRRMATVFQEPLLADRSVAENVALGLRFRGLGRRETHARVARWLARFGVGHLAARSARTLSGGEAQRVALARALVLEPEVLLLDEPFAALDAPTRAGLVADLGGVLREDRVTTVLITHDRGEAQALADRVAVLIAGRLRQVDTTSRVFWAPASEDVARFVGVETIVTGRVVATDDGVARVEVGGRTLEIAAGLQRGARVRLGIRPEDVTLAAGAEPPPPSSARNALAGIVRRLRPGGPGVHVVVDVGFPLVALVTPRSAAELGLAEGVGVTAVFKATVPHVIAAGLSLDTADEAGL
jgi:tungstate transport system ATP-binding protein